MSDVHAAEAATDNAAPPQESDTEVRARRLGWVPKEEFKGDPAKHRSADEFLERGTTILPILQKDNERLHTMVSSLQSELKETKDATKELLEFTTKAEERAFIRAKADLEKRIETAAATADPAAAKEAMRELDELRAGQVRTPAKTAVDKPAVTVDPEIQEWIGKETWFTKSPVLNTYATDVFGDLEKNHPGMSKAEMLAETKRRTVEKFPEKFGINPAREGVSAVGTPRGEPPRKKTGKTYDDLPAEAKRACDKFVKQIPGYTREKYVKDYDWND